MTALTLKLSYFSGTQFVTEIISGDSGASAVRLIFLSTGIPWVFWISNGSSVKGAVRSAPLTSAGTWKAGVIDIGAFPTALEVSANPNNQIGVSFLTDVAATGRPRFLFCSTCNGPSDFVTFPAATYVENNPITTLQVGMGMSWCNAGAGTYYPALSYSMGGSVHYAICQNTLTSCNQSASWSTRAVNATPSENTKVVLSPSVVGDVPKVMAQLGGVGLKPYQMGNTLCTAALVAFSAGAAIGTGVSGTSTMNLLEDVNSQFHMIANESTTNVMYYNSQSTNFIGVWNGAGAVETATMDASMWGGADIDNSSKGVYTSYGLSSGDNDLRIARVQDYTVASNSVNFAVSRYQLDVTGNIQLSVNPKRHISMNSTSTGIPAAVYTDYSSATPVLKYAVRNGYTAASTWNICTLPDTVSPQTPSLVFDSSDHPWIAYYDGGLTRFFLATNSTTNCSGTWEVNEYPYVPSGVQQAIPALNDARVAVYQSGGNSFLLMTALDTNAVSHSVTASLYTPSTHLWATPTSIDLLSAAAASNLDLDTDAAGNAVITYLDLNLSRVKYVATADGKTWSTPVQLSDLNQGMGARVKINPVSGSPSIAYFDRAFNTIYYEPCSGTPASCALSSALWTPTGVDLSAGVSGLTNVQDQLLSASIVFNSLGIPYLVYPHGQGADGNLTATEIAASTVTTPIAHGINTNLADTPAFTYGTSGWGVAATRNAANLFTAVHLGPGNWLNVTSCGD